MVGGGVVHAIQYSGSGSLLEAFRVQRVLGGGIHVQVGYCLPELHPNYQPGVSSLDHLRCRHTTMMQESARYESLRLHKAKHTALHAPQLLSPLGYVVFEG